MELRTTFNIKPSDEKITYNDRVMFIGSCFASSMGNSMATGKMPVMINPSGAVFNPVSVCKTLDTITAGREFVQDDLFYTDGSWLSFSHYTDFSSSDPFKVLKKINNKSKEASVFLANSSYLFVTFGTARIYRFKETGLIVSNCHKLPASMFESELLTVAEIVKLWADQIEKLNSLFPDLKIVFTISPVRHWKDGAHGNQVSKAVLFLSVEELLKQFPGCQYFPAYELVMDDLRDYRFYSDDMLHPSTAAVNYIWDAFSSSYFDSKTITIRNEVIKIAKAFNHRFNTDSFPKRRKFAEQMLKQISELLSKVPEIDLSNERSYFLSLLNE